MVRTVRRLLPYLAPWLALVLLSALSTVANAAPGNPADQITTGSCSWGSTTTDGLSRLIAGISVVLLFMALVTGIASHRSSSGGGGGGGEAVGGMVTGLGGFSIGLLLLGMVGALAALFVSAAGLHACP